MTAKAVPKKATGKPKYTKADQERFLNEEVLPFAIKARNHIGFLKNFMGPIHFKAVGPYEEKILAYMLTNASRYAEHVLHGIMAVVDTWPHAKNNRVCVYVCGEGPLFEALGTNQVETSHVEYEKIDLVMRKIFEAVSGLPAPKGVTHYHPHPKKLDGRKRIREELTHDHGAQNPTHKRSDLKYYILGVKDDRLGWLPGTAKDLLVIFNRTV